MRRFIRGGAFSTLSFSRAGTGAGPIAGAITGGVQAHGKRSALPLVEHYQNAWPSPSPSAAAASSSTSAASSSSSSLLASAPARTIPDSKLRFQTKSTFSVGSSIFYPHLKFNPADFKVALVVALSDLGLSKVEQDVLVEMVGPRFNQGKRIVRLTANRFANRIENKKYLIFLLEKLLLEARRIAKLVQ